MFNVPRTLNLPCSNVPQKYVKTMGNVTVHYSIMYSTIKSVLDCIYVIHVLNDSE